jgi:hypothetical protein
LAIAWWKEDFLSEESDDVKCHIFLQKVIVTVHAVDSSSNMDTNWSSRLTVSFFTEQPILICSSPKEVPTHWLRFGGQCIVFCYDNRVQVFDWENFDRKSYIHEVGLLFGILLAAHRPFPPFFLRHLFYHSFGLLPFSCGVERETSLTVPRNDDVSSLHLSHSHLPSNLPWKSYVRDLVSFYLRNQQTTNTI